MRALALALVTACSSWQVQQAPPAQVLATSHSEVRLRMSDGSVHTIHATRIVRGAADGDQVIGFRPRSTPTAPPVAFAVANIQQIEIQEMNVGASLGMVLVGFLAIGAIALAADPPFSDLDRGR